MRVSKEQLRSLVREVTRRKLDLGPVVDDWTPRPHVALEGSLTKDQLQQLIDEEFADAMADRMLSEGMLEDMPGGSLPPEAPEDDDGQGGYDDFGSESFEDEADRHGPMPDDLDEYGLDEKTPPGGEKVVRALKKKKGVKNPWAVAWAMKNRGEI